MMDLIHDSGLTLIENEEIYTSVLERKMYTFLEKSSIGKKELYLPTNFTKINDYLSKIDDGFSKIDFNQKPKFSFNFTEKFTAKMKNGKARIWSFLEFAVFNQNQLIDVLKVDFSDSIDTSLIKMGKCGMIAIDEKNVSNFFQINPQIGKNDIFVCLFDKKHEFM